jgi:nucleoside-diphosphate-sugar epimerase
MNGDTLLMIGGSGAMGQHVIKQLLKSDHKFRTIRVFTRNPAGQECCDLVAAGQGRIELVRGNVNDEGSLRAAIKGTDVLFLNTNFWSCLQDVWADKGSTAGDPWPSYKIAEDMDVEQSKQVLEIARLNGVQHVVLSSLDDANKLSEGKYPAPHFDAKARVDKYVDQQKSVHNWYGDSVTSLLTAPYMENFVAGRMFRGGGEHAGVQFLEKKGAKHILLRLPLGDSAWPMVTLDDIGRFTTIVLNDEKEWKGKTLKIVSEPLTMQEIAKTIKKITGIETAYDPFTLSEYKSLPLPERPALGNMFGLVSEFGLDRDRSMLRQINPEMDTFEGWLKSSGWKGEVGKVQKDNAQPIK